MANSRLLCSCHLLALLVAGVVIRAEKSHNLIACRRSVANARCCKAISRAISAQGCTWVCNNLGGEAFSLLIKCRKNGQCPRCGRCQCNPPISLPAKPPAKRAKGPRSSATPTSAAQRLDSTGWKSFVFPQCKPAAEVRNLCKMDVAGNSSQLENLNKSF